MPVKAKAKITQTKTKIPVTQFQTRLNVFMGITSFLMVLCVEIPQKRVQYSIRVTIIIHHFWKFVKVCWCFNVLKNHGVICSYCTGQLWLVAHPLHKGLRCKKILKHFLDFLCSWCQYYFNKNSNFYKNKTKKRLNFLVGDYYKQPYTMVRKAQKPRRITSSWFL